MKKIFSLSFLYFVKALGLHRSTGRDTIYKGRRSSTIVNLPRSDQTPKISRAAWQRLVQEVTKDRSVILTPLSDRHWLELASMGE